MDCESGNLHVLATKFDLENSVIKDDVANIEINAKIVERALRLPSCGDEFSEYYPDDSEYEALKSRWGKFTLADLKGFVIKCAMQIEEQRMLFHEAFILFLGKTFFCPTTNSFLSPERHFPLVVDVKNPMQYNWSLQIFTWIKDAIKDFQKKALDDKVFLTACFVSDDQEEGEGYNAHEEEQINNERDNQSEEVVIEDEEVLKRLTQIEEELKSQRRTIGIEKKKLTKEQEEEIEATLKE
ncbi:hypothetical protein PIB30_060199 [Stylosanthes scabra]|uniref:Uncharacterized protein n=1 Tax=Stylosanthes scabra TaxID=79078 RepID=A0ABU6XIC7_9FABA|nr:hypothetical protein [Stylosanthes scabra]